MENHSENDKKRARSANFSLDEKLLLINTAAKYKHVLENKKTDNVTSQEKAKVWIKIAEQVNSIALNGCYRSVECLKRFYDNEKKKVRKVAAEEKKEIILTGGGPKVKVLKDPCHDLLLSILNEKTVHGLENPFDSDGICSTYSPSHSNDVILEYTDENDFNFNNTDLIQKVTIDQHKRSRTISPVQSITSSLPLTYRENDFELSETSINHNTWKKYKPTDLRAPVSSCLIKKPYSSEPSTTKVIIHATSAISTEETQNSSKSVTNNSETPKQKRKSLEKKDSSRRRPATTVKALTSSNVAEKYDKLLNARLEIADFQKKKLQSEINVIEIEHKFKVKLLELELELKKEELKRITNESSIPS